MVFAHDVELALQAATVLANSSLEPDTLETVEALEEVFSDYSYSGRHDADEVELEAVRALRAELRALLTASRDQAVTIVNRMIAEEHALPRLVRHNGLDWHLHATEQEDPLPRRIRVETALAMIDVIRSDEMSRLGLCADDECQGVVLDLSRNRSKRFCSTSCGNRNAVAAYRARQAAD